MNAGLIVAFMITAPVLPTLAVHWTRAAAGSSARVWVNHSGSLTGRPLQRAQLQRRIVMAGVLTAVMLGLVLCLAGGAGRFLFNRRRLADWDKAWRAVGPRWTRQL